MGLGVGALVTGAAVVVASTAVLVAGAAVVTGALVLGTVVVVGATVVVLGTGVVELGAAGSRQDSRDHVSLICTRHSHRTTAVWKLATHLRPWFLEHVICLRWHPAHWWGWWL